MPERLSDVLEEISVSELPSLLQIIAKELPASTYPFEFLKTVSKWHRNDPSYDVLFFRPTINAKESGIFVAILRTGNVKFGLFLYAVEGYDTFLERILMQTNKINWDELPLIEGIMPRHYELIENVVKAKHFIPKVYVDTTVQYLDPNIASNYIINCPSDVYIAQLTTKEIDEIYDSWPHKSEYTRDDIRYPIEQSVSFGIFRNENNELLAWVLQTHYGAIGMLYTKENVRRHGYAKTLAKVMAKELTKQSVLPYAMVMANNTKSISLFHSIGFKQIIPMRYISVCKS